MGSGRPNSGSSKKFQEKPSPRQICIPSEGPRGPRGPRVKFASREELAPMAKERSYASAAARGGVGPIVITGGDIDGDGDWASTCEQYNVATDTWSPFPSMNQERAGPTTNWPIVGDSFSPLGDTMVTSWTRSSASTNSHPSGSSWTRNCQTPWTNLRRSRFQTTSSIE